MLQLERELVQARLKEAESQCALKEMQDKILDMEKVGVHEREALLQLQPSSCVTTGLPWFCVIIRDVMVSSVSW